MRFTSKCMEMAKFTVKSIGNKSTPLPPLPTVQELVKLYRVRAMKQLSQNFLYDPGVINRFVSCMNHDLSGYHVCEVGPGPGSITRSILEKGADHVTVVEKDPRFLPFLRYVADVVDGRMSIVHGDILKYDISRSFPKNLAKKWDEESPKVYVFGNLPFNISLPLLFKWLDLIYRKDGPFELGRIPFVLTFQSEVAERLSARRGSPQRSRISVTSQCLCDIEYRFNINSGSFVPKPEVEVGVVKLTPKVNPIIDLPVNTVDHVVKHVMFGRRKKKCIFGASMLFPPKRKDLVEELFKLSGVVPETRAVNLDDHHFRDLCYAYEEIAKRIPQLKLVRSNDQNQWRKHFDEQGHPKSDANFDHIEPCLNNDDQEFKIDPKLLKLLNPPQKSKSVKTKSRNSIFSGEPDAKFEGLFEN